VAVGTPANPEGQLQTSFLFFDTQSELGPHAFPIEQGSLHFPLLQTSWPGHSALLEQPNTQTPDLQVSPA
jgi:hypothetical protein